MGARASRRRHEGRRIRKARRDVVDLSAPFVAFGKAADSAAKPMMALEGSFRGWAEQIALWQERYTPPPLRFQAGPPYPTQSGVEAVRSAPAASPELRGHDAPYAWVDEAAHFANGGTPINPG